MNQEKIEHLVREAQTKAEHSHNHPKGGQQVSISPRGCTISHPDVSISIFYGEGRSFSDNQRMARILFREALKTLK